jgi:hypothetical protein
LYFVTGAPLEPNGVTASGIVYSTRIASLASVTRTTLLGASGTAAGRTGQYRLVYSDGKTPTPNLYTTPACIDWNAEAYVRESNLG